MSEFAHYGGSDEEFASVRRYNAEVVRHPIDSTLDANSRQATSRTTSSRLMILSQETDPDNFENWENLIKAAETLDGGLNRNSSPTALAAFRDAFDRFLLKFPLLFGYWKKYADTEFNIAGPESAEMVRSTSAPCLRAIANSRSPTGIRTWMRKHHQLCRSLDRLLLFQNGNHSRPISGSRVSICAGFLPLNISTDLVSTTRARLTAPTITKFASLVPSTSQICIMVRLSVVALPSWDVLSRLVPGRNDARSPYILAPCWKHSRRTFTRLPRLRVVFQFCFSLPDIIPVVLTLLPPLNHPCTPS